MLHESSPALAIHYGFDEERALPFWEMSDRQLMRLMRHLLARTIPSRLSPQYLQVPESEAEYVDDLDLVVGTAEGDVVSVELDGGGEMPIVAQLKRRNDHQANFALWYEDGEGAMLSGSLIVPASCVHLLRRSYLFPSGVARNFVTVGQLSTGEGESDWEVVLPMVTEKGIELFHFGVMSIGVR